MAYKMKGFSYPGKAPAKSPIRAIDWAGLFGNKDNNPLPGSLMSRITSWAEKRKNKIEESPEEKAVNRDFYKFGQDANQPNAVEKNNETPENPFVEDKSSIESEVNEKDKMTEGSEEVLS